MVKDFYGTNNNLMAAKFNGFTYICEKGIVQVVPYKSNERLSSSNVEVFDRLIHVNNRFHILPYKN